MERLVQPVGTADVLDDFLRRAAHLAGDGERRVARGEADQEEVEDDDGRDQRGGVEEAAGESDGELHGGGSEGGRSIGSIRPYTATGVRLNTREYLCGSPDVTSPKSLPYIIETIRVFQGKVR